MWIPNSTGRARLSNHLCPADYQPDNGGLTLRHFQIDNRMIENIINYETSYMLGKLSAPTPDHFVPILYSLALMDNKNEIESAAKLPAFSDRSFIIKS